MGQNTRELGLRRALQRARPFVTLVGLIGVAPGCAASDSSPSSAAGGSAGDAGSTGGSGGSAGGNGGSAGSLPDLDAGSDRGFTPCVEDERTAQRKPLAVLLVVDRSASMNVAAPGGTRWQAVRSGLTAFLADPDSASLDLGLSMFPQILSGEPPQSCTSDADCGAYGPCQDLGSFDQCFAALGSAPYSSCEPADYAPLIDFAPTPSVAPGIDTALAITTPSGNTPTSVALQSGIDALRVWGLGNPEHALAVVLATDGDPTDCLPTNPTSIAALAALGRTGSPSVSTFVIGVGTQTGALEQIARAGTEPPVGAFFADINTAAAAGLSAELRKVRRAALGCDYRLPEPPEGSTLDPDLVNVYQTRDGEREVVPRVDTAAECGAEPGWFYQMENGQRVGVELCNASCERLDTADQIGVNIALGCTTVVK